MKRLSNSICYILLIAALVFSSRMAQAQLRGGLNINFQTFYDELSPYGEWIDYPEYGYTWRPRVSGNFRPYSTNGYWVYADDQNWMWNSEYDWGWGPFHYGRWFQDPYYGWLWVPGYEWSPAWVSWRSGGDYYGWAPIRPGISINVGVGSYNPPYDYWTFAPCRYMTSRYISRYYHPYGNNMNIYNGTTIINNYYGDRGGNGRNRYYTNGPRRSEVERYTGRICSVSLRDAERPGRSSMSKNEMSVYRPNVSRDQIRSDYSPRSVQRYERGVMDNLGTARIDMRNGDGSNGNRDARINTSPRNQDPTSRNNAIRQNNDRWRNDQAGRENSMSERSRNMEMRSNPEGNNRRTPMEMQRPRQDIDRSGQRFQEMRQRNIQMQERNMQMRQQNEIRQQRESRK